MSELPDLTYVPVAKGLERGSSIDANAEITVRKSVTDLLAESKRSSYSKDIDRDLTEPSSPGHERRRRRHREHRRAARGDTIRDSSKERSSHQSHQRHRKDFDSRSHRSGSDRDHDLHDREIQDQDAPPKSPQFSRRLDTGSNEPSHGDSRRYSRRHPHRDYTPEELATRERRKAERTPEEQANHERRKAERRAAREARERDRSRVDRSKSGDRNSLRHEKGKGKLPIPGDGDRPPSPGTRRSSRRFSISSNKRERELLERESNTMAQVLKEQPQRSESPASMVAKKFLDIRNSESFIASNFPPRDTRDHSPRPSSLRSELGSIGKGKAPVTPNSATAASLGSPLAAENEEPAGEKKERNKEKDPDSRSQRSHRDARQKSRQRDERHRRHLSDMPPAPPRRNSTQRSSRPPSSHPPSASVNNSGIRRSMDGFRRSLDGVRNKLTRVKTDTTDGGKTREFETEFSSAEAEGSSSAGDHGHHDTARKRRMEERRKTAEKRGMERKDTKSGSSGEDGAKKKGGIRAAFKRLFTSSG